MAFHYHVNCDGCGLEEPEWDRVPEGWVTVSFQHPMEREAHFCHFCWEQMRSIKFQQQAQSSATE